MARTHANAPRAVIAMRILYFTVGYTTHDRRFLTAIAQAGHDAVLLRLGDDGIAPAPDALPDGVRSVRWQGVAGHPTIAACLERVDALAAVIREIQPDLVHAGPIPTCGFMAALTGFCPLVTMSWGSDILVDARDDEVARSASARAIRASDAIVVDCDAVCREVCAIGAVDEPRIVQFPWGLELERHPRRPPRPMSRDEICVLSTRAWAPIYDVPTAVAAFALAHAREPRLRLTLVGDGPLAPQIRAQIVRLGISDVVRCPGRLAEDRLAAEFAAADVYLSCALSDGTSISLLEAMASGLPPVVTDVPGNREWVDEGRGGWLAQPSNADAFAGALLTAAALDVDGRSLLAHHNRAIVERRADWQVNARKLIATYERLRL